MPFVLRYSWVQAGVIITIHSVSYVFDIRNNLEFFIQLSNSREKLRTRVTDQSSSELCWKLQNF